jgi:RNA recognition motif-containing protein
MGKCRAKRTRENIFSSLWPYGAIRGDMNVGLLSAVGIELVTRSSNVALRLRTFSMAEVDSIQPNTTLYINNINDKINKDEIRSQLYALFTTYGKLIDVVATKTPRMRGQAFLVFTDLAAATAALRACDGMIFYNKPMVRPYE